MLKKNTKNHEARKNPGSAEFFRKQRKARNEARGKQKWVGGKIVDGSHWERD